MHRESSEQRTRTPSSAAGAVLTRAMLADRIRACLSGTITETALAAWAFDRFYAIELGSEMAEADAEELITDLLDRLMFNDTPEFRIAEAELRSMVEWLERG